MRIVIDLQGAQTESRFRGIGRYSLSLAQAIARNRGDHEVVIALNALFPETIEPIRNAFDGLLPQENIRVWHAVGPVLECRPGNERRREAAEKLREAFLASLEPDIVYVTSIFEGFVDDGVTSVGAFSTAFPTVVTLYDLIPLLNPEKYFTPHPMYEKHYRRKLEFFKRATGYVAISDFSAKEGVRVLQLPEDAVTNISTACSPMFTKKTLDPEPLFSRLGITKKFILNTGGADERKNLPRLIQAFASLPVSLKERYQLVLAGKFPEAIQFTLSNLAQKEGIPCEDCIFTGYIPDDDLVTLYTACSLFVFPSWHEGFGIPPLEAMSCGAPVIAANSSSLPEVMGWQDALFDPFDVDAISKTIQKGLEDEQFRIQLLENAKERVTFFSWDNSAKKAITVFEEITEKSSRKTNLSMASYSFESPQSAYTPLIKALCDIPGFPADFNLVRLAQVISRNHPFRPGEKQLFLDVSELAQRDSATGVQRVVRSYLKALLQSPPSGFRIEPVYATVEEGYRYARRFTAGFMELPSGNDLYFDAPVQWQRGDIFFGLDMQHHVQLAHSDFYSRLRLEGVVVKFLVYDLLPIQLPQFFKDTNAGELHARWLKMLAASDGVVCISKATADAYRSWLEEERIEYASNFQISWVHIGADIDASRPSIGLPPDASEQLGALRSRPAFLSVGTLEPRKGQQQILDAFQMLWSQGEDFNLVLVGQKGWKTDALAERILNHPEYNRRLFWLQGISDEYLELIYAGSVCLIAASVNEGFGLPLIEAARHKLPIIARDIPVFREVAEEKAFYFAGEQAQDLADAIKEWMNLYSRGEHPKSENLRWSTWRESAEKLKKKLVEENYPCRQLLVDISELVRHDAKSGIQRVVRSILKEWLEHPPADYRVEPVYATTTEEYRYARRFTQFFLGNPDSAAILGLQDDPVAYAPGDIFFGLDLQPQVVVAQRNCLQEMRSCGVRVLFLVHDLLCLRMPHFFPTGTAEGFYQWLEIVVECDGAICVSKATADDLSAWISEKATHSNCGFKIWWSHNGADIETSMPTKGFPKDAAHVLSRMQNSPSFLMVGTIEPRKRTLKFLTLLNAYGMITELSIL